MQGVQVWSLVGEQRSHRLRGMAKNKKQTNKKVDKYILNQSLKKLPNKDLKIMSSQSKLTNRQGKMSPLELA